MTTANVICIKWGTAFPAEQVNILFRAAQRNTAHDLRFFCLTDDPMGLDPRIEPLQLREKPFEARMNAASSQTVKRGLKLRKVAMFRPDLIPDLDGPLLALDIDVVITGGLDALLSYAPGKVCMAKPFSTNPAVPTLGEGSVLRFDPKLHPFLYHSMAEQPETMAQRAQGSEQTYTSQVAQDHGVLESFPDAWVVSFKKHCRPRRPLNLIMEPRLPNGARVVCFHGKPDVTEAIAGFRSGPLKSTLPARWLQQHYT